MVGLVMAAGTLVAMLALVGVLLSDPTRRVPGQPLRSRPYPRSRRSGRR